MTLNKDKGKQFCHGGDIYSEESPLGHWLDYSANINPLGMTDSVKNSIMASIDGLVHYPDPKGRELKQAISARYDIPVENIILGNGAAELFYVYFHAIRPGRVLLPVPSFSEYEKAAQCCGAQVDYFFLKEEEDFQVNLSQLAEAMKGYDAVILGNPNNPTGQLLEAEVLENFIVRAKELGVQILVDESFLDFLADREHYAVDKLVLKYHNLLVITSLTKFFAIPGLRLGFGLASADMVERLEFHKDVWNVNSLAQAAGKAALSDKEFMAKSIYHTADTVAQMTAELKKLKGIKVFTPSVNFVLVDIAKAGLSSRQLVSAMRSRGILIRDCSSYPGLGDNFVRLAIRGREENLQVLQTLAECLVNEGQARGR